MHFGINIDVIDVIVSVCSNAIFGDWNGSEWPSLVIDESEVRKRNLSSFFGNERCINWYAREAGCAILLILMIILVLVLIDVSVDDIYISVNDGMKYEERCYIDMTCAS